MLVEALCVLCGSKHDIILVRYGKNCSVIVVSRVEESNFCPKQHAMKGEVSKNIMHVYVQRFIMDLPLFPQCGTAG